MTKAVIMAVVDEHDDLQVTSRMLRNRYGSDYDVICDPDWTHALDQLRALCDAGQQVAMVLADQWMPEMTGTEFLTLTRQSAPHARRVLLFERDDPAATEPRFQAMALGQIDYYVLKPLGEPDEVFHQVITDLLAEWCADHQSAFEMVKVIGETWESRSHEFRDLLERNNIPHSFYDVDTDEGRALLQEAQRPAGPFPVLVLYNGVVLAGPTLQQAAEALGSTVPRAGALYDVVIVGGGPAGLSAAVYAASEGLRTLIVEREAMGGQAGTSSRIRNYLGFPRGVTGNELARRAWEQAAQFGTEFYLMREVQALRVEEKERVLVLSDGMEIRSRAVVLAMGVRYRRLGIPALEALLGAGVFYGAALSEAPAMAGEHLFVIGGGNSAGQAALHLAKYAASVTMVVRGPSLAASMSEYLILELGHNEKIKMRFHAEVVDGSGDLRLERLVLRDRQSGETTEVEAGGLFILIGGHPHTDWLPEAIVRDELGYITTGPELLGQTLPSTTLPEGYLPALLETSVPGVFAVGDVRHRSVKRVASAVGEGSIAVQLVHEYLARLEAMGTR